MKKYYWIILLIIFSACERANHEPRHYVEITLPADETDTHEGLPAWHPKVGEMSEAMKDPQLAQMMQESVAAIALTWTTPQGWTEEKGSGMRLVTFKSQDTDPIECSIVSLSGAAGGIEANLQRWLGQIGLNMNSNKLSQFIQNPLQLKTHDGKDALLFDFTTLQSFTNKTTPSIIAAVLTTKETTIFVKMTGTKNGVLKNRSQLISLSQSLQLHE